MALPKNENAPSSISEFSSVGQVACLIPQEFRFPIVPSSLRDVRIDTAWMLMPEAALDLDDLAKPRKNNVRFARERSYMKPEPKPHSVNKPTHNYFW